MKQNKNKLSMRLLKYEMKNLAGNMFVMIFGLVFPIALTLLIAKMIGAQAGASAPGEFHIADFHTHYFLLNSMMIPLATMFMGHAENYSVELESGAALRMKLFGISERTALTAKFIVHFAFIAFAFAVYCLVLGLTLDLTAPNIWALITWVVFFFIFSAVLFFLGHGIATLCGRFGTTFGVVMTLYFVIMVLSGIMGVEADMLPDGVRHAAMAIPLYWFSTDFLEFWNGGELDWLPLTLSTVGFALISAVVVFLGFYLTKKGKINQTAKPVYYD